MFLGKYILCQRIKFLKLCLLQFIFSHCLNGTIYCWQEKDKKYNLFSEKNQKPNNFAVVVDQRTISFWEHSFIVEELVKFTKSIKSKIVVKKYVYRSTISIYFIQSASIAYINAFCNLNHNHIKSIIML